MVDVEKIYGHWQALSGTLAGNPMPENIVSATQLTLNETTYVVDLAGNIDSGSCSIDGTANPIRLRIDGESGPNAGKTFYAILEFTNADEIRVAYDLSGTDYPNSFDATSEPSSYVATFKRC